MKLAVKSRPAIFAEFFEAFNGTMIKGGEHQPLNLAALGSNPSRHRCPGPFCVGLPSVRLSIAQR